jgi:hypothetical protein
MKVILKALEIWVPYSKYFAETDAAQGQALQ